ncbi:MAG TPA: hypothetical protein VKB50_16610 [Vicinamibacterales bacterium]|nr:hypothetical protein [Vicinamibacterales bacterium]
MATHEQIEQWVNRRMITADPSATWPDLAAGWTDLERRIATRPRGRLIWAACAVAACVAMLAQPAPRAVAQRYWDQVVLGRIQVLIADYDGAAVSVFSPEMQHPPEARAVPSREAASNAAGFSPRVPTGDVFTAPPTYSVTDVASARLRLRTPAIRYLAAQSGASASEVPDSWNGVVLEVRVGPVIIADYDGTLLLQSLPFQLIKPVDFDLALFYRLAFRSLGMSERDAGLLGGDLGLSPALLMFMPKEDRELLHEFKTRTGTGMMIAEVYGPGKTVAIWSGRDRVYALFGPVSRDFVISVANAIE